MYLVQVHIAEEDALVHLREWQKYVISHQFCYINVHRLCLLLYVLLGVGWGWGGGRLCMGHGCVHQRGGGREVLRILKERTFSQAFIILLYQKAILS